MCGILGLNNFKGNRVNDRSLSEAAQSLIHRGTDDTGYWNDQGYGLGHMRLSTNDLTEAGHQPMLTPNNN